VLVLALVPGVAACTVKEQYLVRYYRLDEGQRVKRIVLAVPATGFPGLLHEDQVLAMYQGVVREFVSHHHEYIILGAEVLPAGALGEGALPGSTSSQGRPTLDPPVHRLCARDYDGRATHGVLLSRFERLEQRGSDVALRFEARLIDCETGLLVWRALGQNSYASLDQDLEQTIRAYTNRYGEGVRPFVAGSFLAVRQVFASMPDPSLTDADIAEKIELDALAD
jgi:probable lipoprotein (TIGR04455 family)